MSNDPPPNPLFEHRFFLLAPALDVIRVCSSAPCIRSILYIISRIKAMKRKKRSSPSIEMEEGIQVKSNMKRRKKERNSGLVNNAPQETFARNQCRAIDTIPLHPPAQREPPTPRRKKEPHPYGKDTVATCTQ